MCACACVSMCTSQSISSPHHPAVRFLLHISSYNQGLCWCLSVLVCRWVNPQLISQSEFTHHILSFLSASVSLELLFLFLNGSYTDLHLIFSCFICVLCSVKYFVTSSDCQGYMSFRQTDMHLNWQHAYINT